MSCKKIRILFICLAGLILGMPTVAVAGAESGFYIGLGAGNSTVKYADYSESDSGYKVFGGYNIGFIPLVDFAVEGSYVHFGNPSNTAANFETEVTGLNAFGLAGLSFGPFGIFVKAGLIDWAADTNEGTVSNSESGTDPAYGLGARLAFGSFSVRAEYEYYDLDSDVEIGMASISGIYTF